MPIYEYRCDACGASFEVMQKMSDDPLVTCEKCGGRLNKVLHPVAIHFKGSGFYTTDYGKGSGRRTGGADESPASAAASASDAASSGDGASASGSSATASAPAGSSADKAAKDGRKSKEKQKAT